MPNHFKARDAVNRLCRDEHGVVSFEYLIVAALIIAVVGVVYRTGTPSISTALTDGFGTVTAAFAVAVGG